MPLLDLIEELTFVRGGCREVSSYQPISSIGAVSVLPTNAAGETCDLSKYVVVATSNIGSRMLMESRVSDRETVVRRTVQAGTSEMRPETFARFDLTCIFNKLDYETLRKLGELHVGKCLKIIAGQGHNIEVEPGMIEHVQREGYSEEFGTRPMQNAAMRILGDVASAQMLKTADMPCVERYAMTAGRISARCWSRIDLWACCPSSPAGGAPR